MGFATSTPLGKWFDSEFTPKYNSFVSAFTDWKNPAEIAWIISDVPPTKWEELIHSNFDTRSPFILSFENDQRGKTVYFALRWENTRGEKKKVPGVRLLLQSYRNGNIYFKCYENNIFFKNSSLVMCYDFTICM
jgi:hypothetical protein